MLIIRIAENRKNVLLFECSSGIAIRNKANKYIDDTSWSYASDRKTGKNTNKCNIFVAEVIEEAGKTVPHRSVIFTGHLAKKN